MESFEAEIIMAAIWIFGFIFMAIVFAPSKSKESKDHRLGKKELSLAREEDAA